jgi:hypothetical protein
LFGYLVKVVWDCSKSAIVQADTSQDTVTSELPSGKLA